jgi:hypothetical protein
MPFVAGDNGTNSTFTFNQAWEGILSWNCYGTVLTALTVANVATYPVATFYLPAAAIVNTAGTDMQTSVGVRAPAGAQITLIATATTVTGGTVLVSSGPFIEF